MQKHAQVESLGALDNRWEGIEETVSDRYNAIGQTFSLRDNARKIQQHAHTWQPFCTLAELYYLVAHAATDIDEQWARGLGNSEALLDRVRLHKLVVLTWLHQRHRFVEYVEHFHVLRLVHEVEVGLAFAAIGEAEGAVSCIYGVLVSVCGEVIWELDGRTEVVVEVDDRAAEGRALCYGTAEGSWGVALWRV